MIQPPYLACISHNHLGDVAGGDTRLAGLNPTAMQSLHDLQIVPCLGVRRHVYLIVLSDNHGTRKPNGHSSTSTYKFARCTSC